MQPEIQGASLMNILKTVAAFALALLAAPMVHARTPFPSVDSPHATSTIHTREGSASTAQSQKTIKDPAEYNAYIAALNTQDPGARAAAMEAFLKQYPASIVKIDALEQAMGAYQQANNAAKVQSIAAQILELDPGNIRALAIMAFLERSKASGDPAALKAAGDHCAKGLQILPNWPKPEGASDDEYKKLREQMSQIFNGACGFVALNRKDYAAARGFYLQSLAVDPSDVSNNYQLAIAELSMSPMDLNGFWYAAKAFNLAQGNAPAQKAISDYAKAQYRRYHGGDDGWDQIVAAAASQSAAPPAAFAQSIKPAPTPAEIAVTAVKENDPATLSFSDWEFILSYRDASPANKEAAEKVWAAIQDKQNGGDTKLRLNGVKVIAATNGSIDAALTDDNQEANKADLHVVLEKPLLHPPAPGSLADIIGVLTSYAPDPFMFTMEKGELPAPSKPATPKRPAKARPNR
jgi:tetratricopeptide (TPR) repeat protein